MEKFASRLKEERVRIEPHQGKFAAAIGISQNKQSFLENASRELRADYLAAVAAKGVDVHYVLTGERTVGDAIDAEAADFLRNYLALPSHLRQIARSVLRTMNDEAIAAVGAAADVRPASVTVHEKKSPSATTNR